MRDRTQVKPYEELNVRIYAYSLPKVATHDGCIKVGETTREVEKRIGEQLKTVGLTPKIHFTRKAQKCNGEWFHDKDLHKYFILNNIERKDFGTGADEWFYFNGEPERAEELTDKYIAIDYDEVQISEQKSDYKLRKEQADAVEKTLEYYHNQANGREFLWNAKPRFGKTLTTYDFIRKIKGEKVLIVTNRPAIANSWYDDFVKFIAWQEPNMKFVSDSNALTGKAITREEYIKSVVLSEEHKMIYFVSLQDLKGARVFGGMYDKYEWIPALNWDILIIDEAHEGVDTYKTYEAFKKIKRDFTLHLSGTPFKAIANQKFSEDQIYNWSYLDEQKAKYEWNVLLGANPYSKLPTLNMFTFQMSKLIRDKVELGYDFEESNLDYAFDLAEFFKVEKNKFVYEEDVMNFLDNLSSNKFPFSIEKHRDELKHTLWLLDRVASAKALEKLLKKHPVFKNYKVVLAAGDGTTFDEEAQSDSGKQEKSLDRVKQAIKENERTITLSVGQLTTGVTIPEWTGVLMLTNIKSPALYFQAAFRAQNPYEFVDSEGLLLRKENAYVFDFAPQRTLIIYDEFANNLQTSSAQASSRTRKENIQELLNFFPVIGEDENGELKEINSEEVLTIPIALKSQEVVKRGFMSNLLFSNISSIFSAPSELKEILEKISPEKQGKPSQKKEITNTNPMLNEKGEVSIPKEIVVNETNKLFGEKIYAVSHDIDVETLRETSNSQDYAQKRNIEAKNIANYLTSEFRDGFNDLKTEYKLNKYQIEKVMETFKSKISEELEASIENKNEKIKEIQANYDEQILNSKDDEDKAILSTKLTDEINIVKKKFEEEIKEEIYETLFDTVEKQIENVEEKKKKSTEDEVRDHLRGFARTIPSFLMAYGNANTTLETFDENIDPGTFLDLTSITIDDFKKLRDGFSYIDEETGETKHIKGLFDEIVFNASVVEFFEIKERLADYFNNETDEDIFDYIPPQKTNQIFTPRKVVNMMLDSLEENIPDIFKDKNKKFLDPYIKSGLYLTEISKRLFKGLEKDIPFEEERIKWIFEKQLYGFAPTNIISNISKNFVFGEFDFIRKKNIIECDLVPIVEKDKLEEKIKEVWGKYMKFDVVIGNPPYQENVGNEGGNKSLSKQLFPMFVIQACDLNPLCVNFIIPSRWFAGDAQDKSFLKLRKYIQANNHIKELHFFPNESDVFPGVSIKGGVCYFSWIKGYQGDVKFYTHKNNFVTSIDRPLFYHGFDKIIKDATEAKVLSKILNENFISLTQITKGRNAFGIVGKDDVVNEISRPVPFDESIQLRCKGDEIRYVSKKHISKNPSLCFDRYKVFISKSAGDPKNDFKVIGTPYIGEINTACTDSLIPIGDFKTMEEAENLQKYIRSKFLRFLVGVLKVSHNVYQNVYQLVPLQDFTSNSDIDWSKSIAEIDEQLFEKYGLKDEEREHIKSSIKDM